MLGCPRPLAAPPPPACGPLNTGFTSGPLPLVAHPTCNAAFTSDEAKLLGCSPQPRFPVVLQVFKLALIVQTFR